MNILEKKDANDITVKSIALRITSWLSTIVMIGTLVGSLSLAYILVAPVDVLDDKQWKLTTNAKEYRLGDDVNLTINYKKVKNITGTPSFYMECVMSGGGLRRYPAFHNEDANRPVGPGKIEATVQLPKDAPFLVLPGQCRIAVAIDYRVYIFRNFNESNQSNYFTVQPN